MKTRVRVFLLSCLAAAAAFCALCAYQSIRRPWQDAIPGELYEGLSRDADSAAYLLRGRGGYVVVIPRLRGAEREQATPIELSTLRRADRAMLEFGIPAADRQSMLMLLEDLGS